MVVERILFKLYMGIHKLRANKWAYVHSVHAFHHTFVHGRVNISVPLGLRLYTNDDIALFPHYMSLRKHSSNLINKFLLIKCLTDENY